VIQGCSGFWAGGTPPPWPPPFLPLSWPCGRADCAVAGWLAGLQLAAVLRGGASLVTASLFGLLRIGHAPDSLRVVRARFGFPEQRGQAAPGERGEAVRAIDS
jgi:hypothetical protein